MERVINIGGQISKIWCMIRKNMDIYSNILIFISLRFFLSCFVSSLHDGIVVDLIKTIVFYFNSKKAQIIMIVTGCGCSFKIHNYY